MNSRTLLGLALMILSLAIVSVFLIARLSSMPVDTKSVLEIGVVGWCIVGFFSAGIIITNNGATRPRRRNG
jgi:hypothetical protein